jgi:hypothetical protein
MVTKRETIVIRAAVSQLGKNWGEKVCGYFFFLLMFLCPLKQYLSLLLMQGRTYAVIVINSYYPKGKWSIFVETCFLVLNLSHTISLRGAV